MRRAISILAAMLLVCGCASTTQKRQQERAAAYNALSPEMKSLVDQGRIKVGMPMDAVYIAWGKPAQILESQSANGGHVVTWLYHGTALEEYRYWNSRPTFHGNYPYSQPYLEHDYYPRGYVSAEVTFENRLVTAWHTLPAPVY